MYTKLYAFELFSAFGLYTLNSTSNFCVVSMIETNVEEG